jgi:hypothetical protein
MVEFLAQQNSILQNRLDGRDKASLFAALRICAACGIGFGAPLRHQRLFPIAGREYA